MQAVLFIGIQGSGKSTFFRSRFFNTHVRINLDMLRTRRRESILLRACVEAKQSFVVDNTNPTSADRTRYIAPARSAGFRVVGYYFGTRLADAVARNDRRGPAERVPLPGLLGTHRRLQRPDRAEGFDELFYVRSSEVGIEPIPGDSGDSAGTGLLPFEVEAWQDSTETTETTETTEIMESDDSREPRGEV